MTDGHSCQLSQRSVVGIGVARVEVKDAEDQYAWSTVNIVTMERDVMASRPGRECKFRHWRTEYNREDVTGPGFAFSVENVMAVTVARPDVAMTKWLGIVGAVRIGRTAVPHRHG